MLVAAANVQEECPWNNLEARGSKPVLSKSTSEPLSSYSNMGFVKDENIPKVQVIQEDVEHPNKDENNEEDEVSVVKVQIILKDDDEDGAVQNKSSQP